VASLEHPDLERIGQALVDLASDLGYLAPHIAAIGERSGAWPLHVPARGPRLMLVHRLAGTMGAIHDHGVWVALATVVGLEAHRRYRRSAGDGSPRVELGEERFVAPRQQVTLLPPDDVHAHGHLAGRGEPAWLLILTGDDQARYRRNEWDTLSGRHRSLEVGDRGRWLDTETFPGA
jgi:predicted metal-dependent enzyme (double-stranded beta helix superfamily)